MTNTNLTYTIFRTCNEPEPGNVQLVAVGAGITNTDEMAWDEKLLAMGTVWLPGVITRRYLPELDTVYFQVHDGDLPTTHYLGSGPFPLTLESHPDAHL